MAKDKDKDIKEVKTVEDRKEYIVKGIIKLGSNKNGTPKKVYNPNDKILLTDLQAKILKKDNKI